MEKKRRGVQNKEGSHCAYQFMSCGLEGSDGIDCHGNDLLTFMSPDDLKIATKNECDYLSEVV